MILLKWPAFPNPFWFSSRGDTIHEGVVISEKIVKTHIENLTLLEGVLPPIGTKVIITPSKYNLSAQTVADARKEKERLEKEKEEKRRLKDEEEKEIEKRIRRKAEIANSKLFIPVKWTSGFKSVLSGLSEKGWGNGINRRSVVHILLLEDIKEGSFKRNTGSFLCTSTNGTDGKEWIDLERTSSDSEGKYVSEITCKACLKTAQRWNQKKASIKQ